MAHAAASKPTEPASSQKPTSQSRPTNADAVAHGSHEIVRDQIAKAFQGFCNDTCKHLAGIPLKEKYCVFQDELRSLQKNLGKVLRKAGKDYTRVAMAYRSELGTDLVKWVAAHVKTDRDGITRDRLEHWIGQAVWRDASADLPAWIIMPELARPGCQLSELVVELPEKAGKAVLGTIDIIGVDLADVDLAATLPMAEREWALSAIWVRFCGDLEKSVKAVIQSARVKLAALPTSKPITADKQLNAQMIANRNMSNPATHPLMTYRQAMAALQLSKSAIYDHPRLVRVTVGKRAVRFTTESVIAVKNSAPE